MSDNNQWVTLWVLEREPRMPSLLLYGHAAPTNRDKMNWKGSKSETIEKVAWARLSSVLTPIDLASFFTSIAQGALKLQMDDGREYNITGRWVIRRETEAPPPDIHPYSHHLTNLADSGSAVRKTAWSLSLDPLCEFLRLGASEKNELDIRASNEYRRILETLTTETGLNFCGGDDVLQLGNFDCYQNRIQMNIPPEVSGISCHTITQKNVAGVELQGLRIQLSEALQALGKLSLAVEFHSTFDRTFCKLIRIDPKDQLSVDVLSDDLEPLCSYSVEVYRDDLGEPVTSEAHHIIRSIGANMALLGQQRDIHTKWAARQRQTRPDATTQHLTRSTLKTNHPIMAPSAKDFCDDPWNFLARRKQLIAPLFSDRAEEPLLPTIHNVTDNLRIDPLLKLIDNGEHSKIEIFDPYFDSSAVQKLLLRSSTQNGYIVVYTNEDTEKPIRIEELKKTLKSATSLLPCHTIVNVLKSSFHDRFLFCHQNDEIRGYVLTNSLDKFNCNYPLFIVKMSPRMALAAYEYVQGLAQTPVAVEAIFNCESVRKEKQTSLAKSLNESKKALTKFREYKVLKKKGFIDAITERVPESLMNEAVQYVIDRTKSRNISVLSVVQRLFSRNDSPNYEHLAMLVYHGILDGEAIRRILIQRIRTNKEEKNRVVMAIRNSFLPLEPSGRNYTAAISAIQCFEEHIHDRFEPNYGIAHGYKDLSTLLERSGPIYDCPSPHRSELWCWISLADAEAAYSLFIELIDVAWIAALVRDLYFCDEFVIQMIEFAKRQPQDSFLFAVALFFITSRPPNIIANGLSARTEQCLALWQTHHPVSLGAKLKTYANIVALGKVKDAEIDSMIEKVSEEWKEYPLAISEFTSVNQLVRGGIADRRNDRVYALSRRLKKDGELVWAEQFENYILGLTKKHFMKESTNFHYDKTEDDVLLAATIEILRNFKPDARDDWIDKLIQNQTLYLPNRPFARKRNYDTFVTAINQVALWLRLRLELVESESDHCAIFDDFKTYLIPGAFAYDDLFGILKSLLTRLKSAMHDARWEVLNQEAKNHLCGWW